MHRLCATYELTFNTPIILKRAEQTPLFYEISIEDFQVKLSFMPDGYSRQKHVSERNWTFPCHSLCIVVSREDAMPPIVEPDENGTFNYGIQKPYFDERRRRYAEVAAATINRAFNFLKYRMWHPFLPEITLPNTELMNPVWTDGNGQIVGKSGGYGVAPYVAGMRKGELGTIPFQKKHDERFKAALENGVKVSLVDEVFYDAQNAIYQGNFRRAVLELAISVEMLAKKSVFSKEKEPELAISELIDENKVHVRVVDLISRVSMKTLGKSFKSDYPGDFSNLENLFKCRNAVAHKGLLIFKDKKGQEQQASRTVLDSWWDSSRKLRKWLQVR